MINRSFFLPTEKLFLFILFSLSLSVSLLGVIGRNGLVKRPSPSEDLSAMLLDQTRPEVLEQDSGKQGTNSFQGLECKVKPKK